jgi:hypothetical protein
MLVKFSGASNEELNRTPLILPNSFKKIKDLFEFLSREHPETRESFLEVDGRVKDGTLVIVDDQDWELLGSEEYELKGEDIILISSLHGG